MDNIDEVRTAGGPLLYFREHTNRVTLHHTIASMHVQQTDCVVVELVNKCTMPAMPQELHLDFVIDGK